MAWNWQLTEWPDFQFDSESIIKQEKEFLLAIGGASAFLRKIDEVDRHQFIIEILSSEGERSARIEGEILNRESLQSSIKKHFGVQVSAKLQDVREMGIAELLCDVYEYYDKPLTHEMLWEWHFKLFQGRSFVGKYREHEEPIQIVSNRLDRAQVFFEAPPSQMVFSEMERYVEWFNRAGSSQSILGRAAIAHLYFENIHPFEDGNGRIGRALIEKSLSQGVGQPILIAVSEVLEKRKKEYYQALGTCNRALNATTWVKFFADVVLQAQ